MRRASFVRANQPIHYVLFVDGKADISSKAWQWIDAIFFAGIIPARTIEDLSVTTSLYEAASGKEIGAYEASSQLIRLLWLPLLPITPFTLAFGPTRDEIYDSPFRAIFIQIAEELQGQTLPSAVDPSRLEIKKTPAHMRREIRVLSR